MGVSATVDDGRKAPQNEYARPWGKGTQAWDASDLERFAYYYGQHGGRYEGLPTFPVRTYQADVLQRLDRLSSSSAQANVLPYGSNLSDAGFEFRKVLVGACDGGKPIISIRGGVHGYEKGGVEASLGAAEILAGASDHFLKRWGNLKYGSPGFDKLEIAWRTLEQIAPQILSVFDVVIHPCISPIPYAFNERWNMQAQDPNRHFSRDPGKLQSKSPAAESEAFMDSIDPIRKHIRYCHDCHETNEMDRAYFRAMRKARDGLTDPVDLVIPEGFYLVLDNAARKSGLGTAIIERVSQVTRIAQEPKILGAPNEGGIVYFDCQKEIPGLCMMYPEEAPYAATTEVWPDVISEAEALAGQLMAMVGAFEYNLKTRPKS